LVVSKGTETLRLRLLVHESGSVLARKNEQRKVITKKSLRAFICLYYYASGVSLKDVVSISLTNLIEAGLTIPTEAKRGENKRCNDCHFVTNMVQGHSQL